MKIENIKNQAVQDILYDLIDLGWSVQITNLYKLLGRDSNFKYKIVLSKNVDTEVKSITFQFSVLANNKKDLDSAFRQHAGQELQKLNCKIEKYKSVIVDNGYYCKTMDCYGEIKKTLFELYDVVPSYINTMKLIKKACCA